MPFSATETRHCWPTETVTGFLFFGPRLAEAAGPGVDLLACGSGQRLCLFDCLNAFPFVGSVSLSPLGAQVGDPVEAGLPEAAVDRASLFHYFEEAPRREFAQGWSDGVPMQAARLQPGLANSGPRVTTADVYPASFCDVI
jgi:hypothetical protein